MNWETAHFFVRNKHTLFFNGWHCISVVVHPFFWPVSYRSEAKWWRYESFSHLRKIKFWGHRQNVAQLDTWISLQMVHLKAVGKVMKYGTPIRLCMYTNFNNTVYTYMQLEILINFIFMSFNTWHVIISFQYKLFPF